MSGAPSPYHGTNAPVLDFIGEVLASVHTTAEIGTRYASLGDAAGLEYTVKNLIAYVRAIAPLVREMRPPQTHGGAG